MKTIMAILLYRSNEEGTPQTLLTFTKLAVHVSPMTGWRVDLFFFV